MKTRSIIVFAIFLLLLALLLHQCVWQMPAPVTLNTPSPSALVEKNLAEIRRIMDAPAPVVIFTPPPPPATSPSPAPEPAPVRSPKPATAKPKTVRRPAATISSSSTTSSAIRSTETPARPTATSNPDIQSGAYYVVRQKVEQGGRYFVVCTIMGDASNRRFGYAISAAQYAHADRGQVFDSKNMTGWNRVNRIE